MNITLKTREITVGQSKIRFENVRFGAAQTGTIERGGAVFVKLSQPIAWDFGCDLCKTPAKKNWNAVSGCTGRTVHFCPDTKVTELI